MAKQSAAKGAKKGRRFGRPRSSAAVAACARRKDERRKAQADRATMNKARRDAGQPTPWEVAQERRTARLARQAA